MTIWRWVLKHAAGQLLVNHIKSKHIFELQERKPSRAFIRISMHCVNAKNQALMHGFRVASEFDQSQV